MMLLKSFSQLLLFANLPILAHGNALVGGIFTDDKGTLHTIYKNSKVLCGAMDAVTLFHFGMEASQIAGTFGERSSSGSNYGGQYFDGNIADHGDHANAQYKPEHFPADPDESERAFINMITDYSPSCSNTNYYCAEIDIAALNAAGWPDLVIFGSFYGYLLTPEFRGNATAAGVPIIELTTAYGSDPGAEELPRGMVEITERWEDLAGSLMTVEDVAAKVQGDKESFCAAAETFRNAAKIAQDRGVRAMGGYLPYSGTGDNGEIGAFISSPERDTVLAMLEELGMPIIHNDAEPSSYYEYFTDFTTGTLPFENIMSSGFVTGDPVPYHVDFWLYDDRVTLDFISNSFAQAWPHKAVVNKQYAYHPANSRIFSYRHAAEILTIIAEPLKNAVKLEPAVTSCTPAADGGYAGPAHRSAGLKPGEYACYQPIDYAFCDESGLYNGPNACYNADGNHNCQCTSELCGDSKCSLAGGMWTEGCPGTCECDPNVPGSGNSSGDDGGGTTVTSPACYNPVSHQCTCSDETCGDEACKNSGGIWSGDCSGTCECTILDIHDSHDDHDSHDHGSGDHDEKSSGAASMAAGVWMLLAGIVAAFA